MKNKKTFIISLIFTLVIMALIFCFSAQNGEESGETSNFVLLWIMDHMNRILPDFLQNFLSAWIRKVAHFSVYFLLGLSASQTVKSWEGKLSLGGRVLTSWLIPILYAFTDEAHQYFVPGRSCQLRDVCIDSCGALLAVVIFWGILGLVNKKGASRGEK